MNTKEPEKQQNFDLSSPYLITINVTYHAGKRRNLHIYGSHHGNIANAVLAKGARAHSMHWMRNMISNT